MRERRQHRRVAATFNVTIKLEDGRVFQGRAADLSVTGIFIHVVDQIPESFSVELNIDDPSGGTGLTLRGKVVHSVRRFGIGVRFDDVNEASRTRLDTLVSSVTASGPDDDANEDSDALIEDP